VNARLAPLVAACLLAACGPDEPKTPESPSAAPEEPTLADPALSAAAAPSASARALDPAKPSGRMVGSWGVSLTDVQKAQHAQAKAAVAANPNDASAQQMLRVVEGMLTQVSLDVTPDTVRMRLGDQLLASPYTIGEDTAEGCTLTTTEPSGQTSEIQVAFDGDVMVWTKTGERGPMRWERVER